MKYKPGDIVTITETFIVTEGKEDEDGTVAYNVSRPGEENLPLLWVDEEDLA